MEAIGPGCTSSHNQCEQFWKVEKLKDMLNVFQGWLKYISAYIYTYIIYIYIYDMMHLCRIIKNSLHPSQIVPFAKLHHTEKGKRKSSIQQKTSLKSLETGHSLVLIIPNSSRFPGFSLISKRERPHIPPPPPPPSVSTSDNPCASGPRLDSRWTGCGVMRKSKPHFRS